ncbi:MAG: hypothetical protein J6C42_06980 [Clostridia bacterium]|nr:hypothetical protein [Clostridia bacterium]
MLYLLQYLAIIAAFALPFLIGGIVRFSKSGERRKMTFCIAFLAVSVVILAASLAIAFGAGSL